MNSWLSSSGTTICQLLGGRSNAYLVDTPSVSFLVDAGRSTRRRKLLRALKAREIQPSILLLTHSHFDHAENAAFLQRTRGIKVWVHPLEKHFLETGTNPPLKIILPGFWQLFKRLVPAIINCLHHEPCSPDGLIEPGKIPPPLTRNIRIMHTPGHSPGSVSIILDNEIALIGDLMFGVFPFTAIPPFGDRPAEMIESWEVLLSTGCTLFLPGHGAAKTKQQVQSGLERLKKMTAKNAN